MPLNQIWIALDGGIWNNDANANPSTNVGGISFSSIPANDLYIASTGSVFTMNADFGGQQFQYTVPTGFTAGWPNPGNVALFPTYDPLTAQGINNFANGNLTINANASQGTAWTQWSQPSGGKFYVETTNQFNTFFTGGVGTGVKNLTDNAGNWTSGAGLTGGGLTSSPGFLANVWVGNQDTGIAVGVLGNGTLIRMAVEFHPTTIVGVQGNLQVGSLTANVIHDAEFEIDHVQCIEFTPINDDRNVILRQSYDSGASWSGGMNKSIGQPGEYGHSVQWRRLGYSRNMVFEIQWDGSVDTSLLSLAVKSDELGS